MLMDSRGKYTRVGDAQRVKVSWKRAFSRPPGVKQRPVVTEASRRRNKPGLPSSRGAGYRSPIRPARAARPVTPTLAEARPRDFLRQRKANTASDCAGTHGFLCATTVGPAEDGRRLAGHAVRGAWFREDAGDARPAGLWRKMHMPALLPRSRARKC